MAWPILIVGPLWLAPLELAFWGLEEGSLWRPVILRQVPARVFLLALLAMAPVNVWLTGRLLVNCWPWDLIERGWLRGLRRMLAALPLVGFCGVLPVWRHLITVRPDWAFRCLSEKPRLTLGARGRMAAGVGAMFDGDPTQRHTLLPILWLFGLHVVFLLFVSLWLAAPSPVPAPRRPVLLGAAVVLHGVLAVLAVTYLVAEAGPVGKHRPRRVTLAFLVLCWLVPMPGPLLGVGLAAWLETEGRRAKTLTFAAHHEGSGVGRLKLWQRAEAPARAVAPGYRKRLSRVLGTGSTQLWERPTAAVERGSFYRLKTLLLWADGAAASAGLALGWRLVPSLEPMWKGVWACLLLLVGMFWLGTLVLRVLGLLRRLLSSLTAKPRREQGRCSLAAGGASPPVICLCGLLAGFPLALGEARSAGCFLALAAFFWGSSVIAHLLKDLLSRHDKPPETGAETILWSMLFLALEGLGAWMVTAEPVAKRLAGPSSSSCFRRRSSIFFWRGGRWVGC